MPSATRAPRSHRYLGYPSPPPISHIPTATSCPRVTHVSEDPILGDLHHCQPLRTPLLPLTTSTPGASTATLRGVPLLIPAPSDPTEPHRDPQELPHSPPPTSIPQGPHTFWGSPSPRAPVTTTTINPRWQGPPLRPQRCPPGRGLGAPASCSGGSGHVPWHSWRRAVRRDETASPHEDGLWAQGPRRAA